MKASESEALRYISEMEHGLIIAVGSGKQGKSCSLHSLIARCWPDRKVWMLDPLNYDISMFPGYRHARIAGEIPVGSVAVIEDVNRVFNSRGSGKDPTLQKWLGIISHKSTIVCITTQSMASTDIEFVRSQDSIIMSKYMHEEDLNFERPEFQPDQMWSNAWIQRCRESNPDVNHRSWCAFPRFNEVVAIPPVDWWSYRNSHMLRDVRL